MNDINLKKNNYRIQVGTGTFYEYEERVLSSGLCDVTLPMQFLFHGNVTQVFYHCSGYTALGELKLNTPREWFEVLGKLMMTLRKAQEFLLDEERMTLELTTIFFHRKQRNVKIAFFPCAPEGTGKKICRLIQKIQKEADQETAEYLQRLHQNIVRDNLDLAAMTRLTANLRREIIQCS